MNLDSQYYPNNEYIGLGHHEYILDQFYEIHFSLNKILLALVGGLVSEGNSDFLNTDSWFGMTRCFSLLSRKYRLCHESIEVGTQPDQQRIKITKITKTPGINKGQTNKNKLRIIIN